MDLEFLNEFAVPIVVAICLCAGYILKHLVPSKKINRFIPLIMGAVGVGLNIWLNRAFTPQVLLGGLFSGLSSTGAYEAFRNLICKKEETKHE